MRLAPLAGHLIRTGPVAGYSDLKGPDSQDRRRVSPPPSPTPGRMGCNAGGLVTARPAQSGQAACGAAARQGGIWAAFG